MDDAIVSMRMQPVEAAAVNDKWSIAVVGYLPGLTDTNPEWDQLFGTIDEDRQMDVHVDDGRLERVA